MLSVDFYVEVSRMVTWWYPITLYYHITCCWRSSPEKIKAYQLTFYVLNSFEEEINSG